eukprot:CAMPEP_0206452328 /NCGR_PEP_ID=MMETSP0324_2-20121206/19882_1 /ASSEMBLY_ACC=CAM_ASM_000836 /TAXON_ID=2866 /ORGANISM="Crypthecodinium cohnii, Strain Seligo" /LENGTH=118 /DNA_ID=CAMNT_0053922401 /DNA_START=165 /DNA_END=521 /DNA_ORIENTATION=+
MKIAVYYSPDPDCFTELEVDPSDSVKSVKQKIISLYSPPDWANTALLAPRGTKEYLENKKRLSQCHIQPGSVLKFSYARNLTKEEEKELAKEGVATEAFPEPLPELSVMPAPARSLPY